MPIPHRSDKLPPDEPTLTVPWHPSVDPATIKFPTRTKNVLQRLGVLHDPVKLAQLTPRDILDAEHSGPATVADFTSTIHAQFRATIDGRIVNRQEVLDQVEELRRDFPIDRVPCDDPRLQLGLQGATIGEALDGKGLAGSLPVIELHEGAVAVRLELGRIVALDPIEALRELAGAILDNPHTDAVVRRLGWDGRGGCILRVAAEGTGVSWQRIQHLEMPLNGRSPNVHEDASPALTCLSSSGESVKRPLSHVTEDESRRLLESLLPSDWIVRQLPKDYGVDLEIEIVDSAVVSGRRVWVQLKGSRRLAKRTVVHKPSHLSELADSQGLLRTEYVSYPLYTKFLRYALSLPFPLLLIAMDIEAGDGFWIPIRNEVLFRVALQNPTWHEQEKNTLRLPVWNSLKREATYSYEGLRWYAQEPARHYSFTELHVAHWHLMQLLNEIDPQNIVVQPDALTVGMTRDILSELYENRHTNRRFISFVSQAAETLYWATSIDVLFGTDGIDYYKAAEIPFPWGSDDRPMPGVLQHLRIAIAAASELLADSAGYLPLPTDEEMWRDMFLAVVQGVRMLSICINNYNGFRQRHLLTEAQAVFRAARPQDHSPSYPLRLTK